MVAVARALSGNIKLLLLDEPFEGLAPAVVQELFRVFDRLRAEIPIVIVTGSDISKPCAGLVQANVVLFIRKPIEPATLAAQVRSALGDPG